MTKKYYIPVRQLTDRDFFVPVILQKPKIP